MSEIEVLDKIAIDVKSHRLLKKLLQENPRLEQIMRGSRSEKEARVLVYDWILEELANRPEALAYYKGKAVGRKACETLDWRDYAAIRILDYIDNAGSEFVDLNLRGKIAVSDPVKLIYLAVTRGTGGAKPDFFEDTLGLFRQLSGTERCHPPAREQVEAWMERYPSGLSPRIVKLREENRRRILQVIIDRIDRGEINSRKYRFERSLSPDQKFTQALEWWKKPDFHLRFAVRSPDLLNEMLGSSLDPDTMELLHQARQAGIPFFVNPYYLSLLHVRVPAFAVGADLAIRHYVIYSRQLIQEFGSIVAWEKEDQVRPGTPNAAGWLVPSEHNVHRRYPDVAILIPDTVGRSCGGLCASCQRMYEFQRGNLNFDLGKLRPRASWAGKLRMLLDYFEEDSQLRDILITGGDALMSSDKSLEQILNGIYDMAVRKRNANLQRPDGQKFAELQRVRLGTRIPVYLPQRITPALVKILAKFRARASEVGIIQLIVQTHFESPMEVTPEARSAIDRLLKAGWMVTNQHVLTAAASRRGHTAKLRQVLEDIGVLPYYTFSVKGYQENKHNFAPHARVVQEQMEEKVIGTVPTEHFVETADLYADPDSIPERLSELRRTTALPFLSTDRTVLNLPGVGKSLTFRVIGITRYGRRILSFGHDPTRAHSPIIHQMGEIVIIESKSVSEYLRQMERMGEDAAEYRDLYGYSIGETEERLPLYGYPPLGYEVTDEITNLQIPADQVPSSGGAARVCPKYDP